MTWDELFESYLLARSHEEPSDHFSIEGARRRLATNTPDDWEILRLALADNERKWLVAEVFGQAPVPKRLFAPMLQAAVYETNPSFNRYFVEPCVSSFGHRKVNEYLLDMLDSGTNFEKAGAVSALYWAGMSLVFMGNAPNFTDEQYATPESRAAVHELDDVWQRRRCTFLKEFVRNSDVDVRRNIIPSLVLREAAYPDDLTPLVQAAVTIARNHDDEYIRHRVEVQLGNETLLKPLPDRARTDEASGGESGNSRPWWKVW